MEYYRKRNTSGEVVLRNYFRDLRRCPPLGRKEEETLIAKFKMGDMNAIRRLVISNLRFVVSIAKRYQFINEVPFEDLIAVGNLGLIHAARQFDETRKVRFISYAVWWIRQAIIQTISMYSHNIRLPLNKVHQQLKIKKLEESLTKKLNRKPNINELAQEAGLKSEALRKFFSEIPSVISLDTTPIDLEEDLYLRDVIPDVESDPEVITEKINLEEEIRMAMGSLSEREKIVITHRFGFYHTRERTLEEIGKLLHLTRERVRQIEAQAIQKLRHPVRSERLRIFLIHKKY
ncbi:MAG: sigma-70 family RNA polymerase sigma factor [Candidatus Riflebacteria bacterium]|nr:sigma-70 family RNA polymerase sigma factor [Candidatus Riflebacteria bacterium]